MVEVEVYVAGSDVGGHCYDGGGVEAADETAGRDAVEVWHDDVH